MELKFEQLNEFLRELKEDNRQELKQDWKHPVLLPHKTGYPKFTNSENVTWIVMYFQNLYLIICSVIYHNIT